MLKNSNMKTLSLTKAILEYLMALSLPQELGILHSSQEQNPFISVNKKNGRKTCRVSAGELEKFRAETGLSISKEEILSCDTLLSMESLIESKSDSVSKEVLSKMVLRLTSAMGTIWNNLELVEDLEEISDGGIVDPAYVWPTYNMKCKPVAEEKHIITLTGKIKNIFS